jgi:UDPglucose 6-dehydrogenase
MRVAVCGAGYVGLASAVTLAHMGHEVRVLDRDRARIDQLAAGVDPLGEPGMREGLRGQRLSFTTDPRAAYRDVDAVMIAVGTPPLSSGSADLSQLESACATLAEEAGACPVLIRSTVPVGTGDSLQAGTLRRFRVISNPEFLREGRALADSLNPDRVVAGGSAEERDAVRKLYAQILDRTFSPLGSVVADARDVPLLWMDRRSAELAKYAANAFLATKLSFVNEIANVAAQVGADIRAITGAIGTDPRIGPAFLRPGIGWGGSCFPKDTRALAAFALESGYDFRVLRAVIEQNNAQLDRFFEMIRAEVGRRGSVRIGLLGLAFKAGTSDLRESPAVALAERLIRAGWHVRAFDPAVPQGSSGLPESVELVTSMKDAADGADALVVATEWPEFAAADYSALRAVMRGDVVLDGRCIVDVDRVRAAGLRYVGICAPGLVSD